MKNKIDELDQKLEKGLIDNKIAFVERINGVINTVELFTDKEKLKEFLIKEFKNDFLFYKTGEEAYLYVCNVKYEDYLSDVLDYKPHSEDVKGYELKIRESFRSLVGYDEFIKNSKDINRDYFKDGVYETTGSKLILEFDPLNPTKGEYLTENNRKVIFEIY